MSKDAFLARRAAFLAQLGEGRVAVVGGKQLTLRNGDVDHRFRQSSDLLYLTGFVEPEAIAVFSPGRDKPFVLFVQPRDPERETWTGRRAGVEGAVAKFGADAAFSVDTIATELPKLLDGAREVMYMHGQDARMDGLIADAVRTLRQGERRNMRAPSTLSDLRQSLYELRLLKDDDALAKTRRAVAITRDAHVAAMKAARDGVMEYEVEALIDYTFRRNDGVPGYGTIVGGGDNATILHYVDNKMALKKGELLLVDAGCEIDGFTADVTRTYPVGARFSKAQRAIYELVLETEKGCIESTKPGTDIEAIHKLAVENLTRGLVELGLLTGDVPSLIEKGAFRRFYMHRTSHWLGLDVHDVGAYSVGDKPRPLAAGMVFTIEPGLYISADATDVPAEFRGIGVRIEDDILVTEAGYENLTRSIPKEVADIEALTTT